MVAGFGIILYKYRICSARLDVVGRALHINVYILNYAKKRPFRNIGLLTTLVNKTNMHSLRHLRCAGCAYLYLMLNGCRACFVAKPGSQFSIIEPYLVFWPHLSHIWSFLAIIGPERALKGPVHAVVPRGPSGGPKEGPREARMGTSDTLPHMDHGSLHPRRCLARTLWPWAPLQARPELRTASVAAPLHPPAGTPFTRLLL